MGVIGSMPKSKKIAPPGKTDDMEVKPEDSMHGYRPAGKLHNKVVFVTGGDSGIGRAAAIACAKEGADIAISYLNEHEDAQETERLIVEAGRKALLLPGDIGKKSFVEKTIQKVIKKFGRLDIVINNAAEQHPQKDILKISEEQLKKTFQTNIFSMFYVVQAALPYLKDGSAIINTTSITAYNGHTMLLDYSATKGAIVSFTRSLALMLAEKGIRVNGVAPGPIWTPLIPSTFPEEKVETFGQDTPMKRPGQPKEVGTCFVFLASDDASYISGEVIHVNGGRIVNG